MYEFDWSSIPGSLPFLWDGMKISLEIPLTAVVFGIVWGTLLAMMRVSSVKPLSLFAAGYVNFFRAVPLVMVLLWFFLIVPRFIETLLDFPPGSDLRLSSAMMGFALFEAAYYSEIIRAGIQTVPKGQVSAASALIDTERFKRFIFLLSALMTGAVVSFSGMIGFIGMMVPHAVRLVVGADHRLLLPASALVGGTFLMAADTVARTVFVPSEVPVGVITALAGGPLFVYLLVWRKDRLA